MRLSPFLVAIFAVSSTFGISKSGNAQISETDIDNDLSSVSVISKTGFTQFSSAKSVNESESSRFPINQNLLLAKSTEIKSEPSVNKQFISTIPNPEIIVNQKENSQNLLLAKSTEIKSEPSVNKQFISTIPNPEIIVNEKENSQNLLLAKSTESKSEPSINKQFISTIPNPEIIVNQKENSQNLLLAKSTEIKSEPSINKQFISTIPNEDELVKPNSNIKPTSTELKEYTAPSSEQAQTSPGEQEPLVLVAEVFVSGVNDPELLDQIYQVVGTQPGRTTTRSQLQQDINAIFATGFFQNVRAIPEDTPLGVRITFEVTPNPVLTAVIVEGAQVFPESETERIFGKQYGETLNLNVLEKGVEQVNQWYQDNGYVLGQVIGAPQVADDGTVTLEVAEGEIKDIQVRFVNADGETVDEEGNEIEGNTREYIITREIELQPGDVFKRETAEKDIRRVFGLGIFEDVRLGLEPAPDDPNKAVVTVNIVEKSTGSVALGGGISSASGLFGTVSYQQQNIGGNNQKLGAEFQVGERIFLADVSFTDPWVGGTDNRLSYTVNAFRRRSISVIFDSDEDAGQRDVDLPSDGENGDRPRVVRTGGGVSFTRPFIPNPFVDPQWTASLGLKYEQVEIQDADGAVQPRDELGNKTTVDDSGKDDLFTVQFGIVNDQRDNPRQTTSGSLLRLSTEQSLPVGSGSIFFNRLRANYSYFMPVDFTQFTDGPEVLAVNLQGGHITGDLPPYEAFPLGGSNTVRGYEDGSLAAARSFLLASVEYRFPIFKVFGGALFVDAATSLGSQSSVIGNPGGVRQKPGNGIGYGAGIRVQSPLGPIRIDYAINDEGDSRFHFGIGERF
ncbi:BamA/TamA family outer membrane protein [Okeania sp.]|uniref:BamA/TamA family outer membrane protein n=1 Tax=Okeania sp. TaxID=3100323 RepID=UPI002B4B0C0A|nr:BamA/TamA family outer membrane protein [Okeania sp.]MEB3341702.1 BamA/TamA family outer membrane protein [Okeania sp.]